jgi:hypothetical protein
MEEHLMDIARAQKSKLAKGQQRAMELDALRPEQGSQELDALPSPRGGGMAAALKRVTGIKKGGARPVMPTGALVGGANGNASFTDDQFGKVNEPLVKNMLSGGAKYGQMLGEHIMKQKGAGFHDDFSKGFMSVLTRHAPAVKEVTATPPSHPTHQSDVTVKPLARGGRKMMGCPPVSGAGAASDKRKARGAAVSKLMKEKGMTLGEASRHIKQHGF